ncbi:MAG: S9 family peptidase [Bacteroidota bacterium]|nr:S9 family peptidase [Bacteroidota bacterium]
MKKNCQLILLLLFVFNISQIYPQKKELTVETIFNSRAFATNQLHGVQWLKSGSAFSFLKYDFTTRLVSIWQHDVKTGKESVLVSGDMLKLKPDDDPFSIRNYSISPDENYILFTEILPARKIKTGGALYIYDIKEKKFFLLAESEQEQSNVKFSPDSKKVGFVRGNNLFVIDINTSSEKQLTFDGSENIINGHFDWVYEEEFQIIDGWEWSPDSKSIAFWRLDQSEVPEVQIAQYDSLYFNFLKYRYPKPGAKNSTVKIGVVNLDNHKTSWMDIGKETDIYIPRIKFTNDPNILSIERLNRLQNHLELLFCNTSSGESKVVIDEKAPQWIKITDDLTFLENSKNFVWGSDKDGFYHLYLFDYSGKQIKQLTSGNWEVKSFVSVDEKNKTVFYTSNERGRRFTDLYSVSFDGASKKFLTSELGTHSVTMSPASDCFIDKYSTINTLPSTYLTKTDGNKIGTLIEADNKPLKDYNISPVEFFSIKTDDNVDLDAYIIKPADFNEGKKYPVLVVQYNGPGSQSVSDSWGSAEIWENLMAQKGYIIICVDCRITGGKGNKAKAWAYKNLGKWEMNDLVSTAKYLRTLNFVDGNRIGIWGWSYGGYTSASAILRAPDYFKAAIAVAPVTSWLFYDTIYTERYMSLPSLNPEGYYDSSPLNYADKLKGKFLLIHGMSDDNVHFQNSVELVNRLVDENKQFSVMYYPGRDHSIYGGNTRIQLYNLMTSFLLNNL